MNAALEVTNLRASLGALEILRGVDLVVPFGEVHALMGPNGSGKSTMSHVLMGKGEYSPTGSAKVDGVEILGLDVHKREVTACITDGDGGRPKMPWAFDCREATRR